MDYEKKYKEALGWMQSLYNGLHGATKEEAEKYFPELAESKDEKVRKELIQLISCMHDKDPRKKDWLAWLEKKGEHDETSIAIKNPEAYRIGFADGEAHAKEEMNTWSEEDDAYKLFAISAVEDYYDEKNPLQKDLVDWLKSLKERLI